MGSSCGAVRNVDNTKTIIRDLFTSYGWEMVDESENHLSFRDEKNRKFVVHSKNYDIYCSVPLQRTNDNFRVNLKSAMELYEYIEMYLITSGYEKILNNY